MLFNLCPVFIRGCFPGLLLRVRRKVDVGYVVDQGDDPARCAEREPSGVDRYDICLTRLQSVEREPAERTRRHPDRMLESVARDHDVSVADGSSISCCHTP